MILTWSENCVITSKAAREADLDANPAIDGINNPTNAGFKITYCKFYVPVVALSAEYDNELLDQLKTGFKRTIKWNKYRSEMFNQTAKYNLNYLIQHLLMLIDYLSYILKMKKIELLLQSIIYQKLK